MGDPVVYDQLPEESLTNSELLCRIGYFCKHAAIIGTEKKCDRDK